MLLRHFRYVRRCTMHCFAFCEHTSRTCALELLSIERRNMRFGTQLTYLREAEPLLIYNLLQQVKPYPVFHVMRRGRRGAFGERCLGLHVKTSIKAVAGTRKDFTLHHNVDC